MWRWRWRWGGGGDGGGGDGDEDGEVEVEVQVEVEMEMGDGGGVGGGVGEVEVEKETGRWRWKGAVRHKYGGPSSRHQGRVRIRRAFGPGRVRSRAVLFVKYTPLYPPQGPLDLPQKNTHPLVDPP